AQRLNRVHRDLLKGKSRGKKVSDIANRWGFWHMGQFASDYRRFYGKLPSETLMKSN
ncbi:MAG: helix-turn-helix domain-containing protein, partial [Phycisphaerae bacterium]|nr:helix-turn-helix domain-containing protein [Phycisphaerae bacterium]